MLYNDEIEFSNPEYEHHFNNEMWHFWIKLKRMSVKEDYPFIKYFLYETLDNFKKVDKEVEYKILGD